MFWLPFIISALAFGVILYFWSNEAIRVERARKEIPHRVLVVGSRGKSGTVRLVASVLSDSGVSTYAKITGTVAEEIDTQSAVTATKRLGPVSASEMSEVLIRAHHSGANAVVFECMAVLPKLIAFVQNKVVQAQIVIIPTIRLDHLEDEGDTIPGITKNILSGLQHVNTLITGETDEDSLKVMRWWARRHHVKLIEVTQNSTAPVIAGHHPTNIETAIAVAGELGIERGQAIDAMLKATREPDSELGWEISREGQLLRFSDLGGANDPQSSAEALMRAYNINPDSTIIPILVNRWDRPLRTIAFAYSVRATPDTPSVGIIGAAVPQVKRALRAQGFQTEQILHISWFSTLTRSLALQTLMRLKGKRKNAWFAMVENIHAFPADQLRKAIHNQGTPISNGANGYEEEKNA